MYRTVYICLDHLHPRSVWSRMSVRSLLRVFLLVLPILCSSAETEVEEVEGGGPGPALEAQPPQTKPWSPPVNTGRGPWMGQPNQAMSRPWNGGPYTRPWRPQPRQWSGPMGHVVPSFPAPRSNNAPWQAPPPPVVQQVTPDTPRISIKILTYKRT